MLFAAGCSDSDNPVLSQPAAPVVLGPLLLREQLLEFGPDGTAYRLDLSNFRVARLSAGGQVVWEVGGLGNGPGLFNFPVALAADTQGRIYVADRGNGEVDVLDSNGNQVDKLGVSQLTVARDLAIDRERGRLYVADSPNHRVQVFSLTGTLILTLGQFGFTLAQDLNFPTGVAVAPDGSLHVVDSGNAHVQIYSPQGQFVGTYGSRGTSLGHFNVPRAIAIDSSGHSYVADGVAGFVTRFSPQGLPVNRFQPILDNGVPLHPQYLSMAPGDRLIVAGQPGFTA